MKIDKTLKGSVPQPDDDWRTDQVFRAFARDDHPYSRFTHGNKKSLVTLPKENKNKQVVQPISFRYHLSSQDIIIKSVKIYILRKILILQNIIQLQLLEKYLLQYNTNYMD